MYKILSVFIMLLQAVNSFSQIWVDTNPVWYFHYEKSDLASEFGEFKITDIGDSLIEGKNCQMLQQEKSIWFNSGGIGYFLSNEIVDTNYVRTDGDTVFYYQNGQFRVLYNFGSNVGDSWLIHVSDIPSNCNDSTYVIVSEIGLINIQGIDYRYINLETEDYPDYWLNGTFIERFGKYSIPNAVNFSKGSLFPYSYCQSNFGWTEFFQTCFNDDFLNYQAFSWCYLDPVYSELSETNTSDLVEIYPNPFEDNLFINGGDNLSEFEVLDCQGKRLYFFDNIELLKQSNLSVLGSGIYFLKFKSNNQIVTRSIIKK